jgi:hypothetical protein
MFCTFRFEGCIYNRKRTYKNLICCKTIINLLKYDFRADLQVIKDQVQQSD